MTEPTIIAHLQELVRKAGRLDRPSVGLLEPEIRSGDKFLLRDPFAGKAGQGSAGARAAARTQDNRAVGAIVVEWGFDVPTARMAAFQSFLEAHEVTLLEANASLGVPAGIRYRGTYSVFSSTETNAGHFRTVWSYNSFGDLDLLSDQYEEGTTFASLIKQLRSFVDESPGAGRSQQIYLLASTARSTDL